MLKKIYATLIGVLCPIALFASAQQTLSIIKPDAVSGHHIGIIVETFEKANLHVAAMKMMKLTPEEAGKFYEIHKGKPFYDDLIKFMTSGPIVAMVIEGENAVARNRNLMGATDPKKAEVETIRAQFSKSMTENAVHGSDSPENASIEINFFFKPNEIYSTP